MDVSHTVCQNSRGVIRCHWAAVRFLSQQIFCEVPPLSAPAPETKQVHRAQAQLHRRGLAFSVRGRARKAPVGDVYLSACVLSCLSIRSATTQACTSLASSQTNRVIQIVRDTQCLHTALARRVPLFELSAHVLHVHAKVHTQAIHAQTVRTLNAINIWRIISIRFNNPCLRAKLPFKAP